MKKVYKTQGIILKTLRYGEADNILTIFSLDEGKIGAIAKGARKTKSKLGPRLENFTEAELVLYRGRNLSTVTQAETIKTYRSLREDYSKFLYASCMCDFVSKVIQDGQSEERIYTLLKDGLSALANNNANYELILLSFDWKLLGLLGFNPTLKKCSCAQCLNKELSVFSIEEGGLICPKNVTDRMLNRKLTLFSIGALKSIIDDDIEKAAELTVDNDTLKQLDSLTQDYILCQLQTSIRSKDFLVR
ncbi:MAG: DNA repair protein RecO [Actinobacteria bacterium]|nr:MAG: DNA repair protein RecO [Actinomycetota bacterium]